MVNRKHIFKILILLLFTGCASQTKIYPWMSKEYDSGIIWGEPVNGLRLGIRYQESIEPFQRAMNFNNRRNIEYTVYIQNLSFPLPEGSDGSARTVIFKKESPLGFSFNSKTVHNPSKFPIKNKILDGNINLFDLPPCPCEVEPPDSLPRAYYEIGLYLTDSDGNLLDSKWEGKLSSGEIKENEELDKILKERDKVTTFGVFKYNDDLEKDLSVYCFNARRWRKKHLFEILDSYKEAHNDDLVYIRYSIDARPEKYNNLVDKLKELGFTNIKTVKVKP